MKNTLPIIISGYARSPSSINLKPFWSGFLNLQKIQTKKKFIFYCHSWNPELNRLIKSVYKPKLLLSEIQPNFISKFFNINTFSFFENQINRIKSPWRKSSFQMIFGYAISKEKSINLLLNDKSRPEFTNVISTRWDIGCSGSKEVNQIIYDDSLPEDKVYLPYYRGIEEGYADMWFVLPGNILKKFKGLSLLFEKSLLGKNNYLELFTKKGWIISGERKLFQEIIFRMKEKFNNKFTDHLLKKFVYFSQENETINISKKIFPKYQALNIHALVKYFFYVKKIRKSTRFLDINDFCYDRNINNLINPLNPAIVISNNNNCFDFSPLSNSVLRLKNFKNITRLKIFLKKCTAEQMIFLNKSNDTNNIDLGLLNAVSHYLNNSTEFYINLNHPNKNHVNHQEFNTDFPGMIHNFGGDSLNMQSFIIKRKEFLNFLNNIGNENIVEFKNNIKQLNLNFLSVELNK